MNDLREHIAKTNATQTQTQRNSDKSEQLSLLFAAIIITFFAAIIIIFPTMKYTRNNYDKKEFRKIFDYMCQQFNYTSIEEKEVLKLYLQKKNYPTKDNQNNKNHINAKKKGIRTL